MKTVLLLMASLFLGGCTDNERAFRYGGNLTVDLPPHQKLVNATWKDTNLWYLTREALPGEAPQVLTFREQSAYGQYNGTVIFREH